ncbi:MAG: ADP-ribosylglycohydrolase family protein [Neisseriaceae bacterium]|nr:ADP-ribosylglycohydrolase family protein [Neisseriaceae bacterium]
MFGAILGDIIGSPFEFMQPQPQTKDFVLFSKDCRYTDDTVMTCAIADGLMSVDLSLDDNAIRQSLLQSVLKWGRAYPNAGYGGMFRQFLASDNPQAYNSFGNGSAMRVSAVGWVANSLDEVLRLAQLSADISHNHIEGIKGAWAVAAAIFMARKGADKAEIKAYIEQQFGYDLSADIEQIRTKYRLGKCNPVACQVSVPDAIIGFLMGDNFEDAIRTTISFGGDTDTTGAICGSIAEAFFGVPNELKNKVFNFLPDDLAQIVRNFAQRYQSSSFQAA